MERSQSVVFGNHEYHVKNFAVAVYLAGEFVAIVDRC